MRNFLSANIWMLALVGWASLLATAVGHDAREPNETEIQDRVFLEETIERLNRKNLASLLLDKSTLEQKLVKEVARLRAANQLPRTRIDLLDELHEYLYGAGPQEADCDFVPGTGEQVTLMKDDKFAHLYKAGEQADSYLYKLLVQRQAKRLAFCKPGWDAKFKQVVASSLDESQQVVGESLYSNLAVYSYSKTSYDPSESPDFEDMQVLLRAPITPAALVVYLSRCPASARLLNLDDQMKNSHLSKDDYGKAIQASPVRPLCKSVVDSQLPELARFYREHIFGQDHQLLMDSVWNSAKSAQLKRVLYLHQPLEVTRWLVVEAACSLLMQPKGDVIVRKTFEEITSEPESVAMEETSVLNSDYLLHDLEAKEEEFKEERHKEFMRGNGYKIK